MNSLFIWCGLAIALSVALSIYLIGAACAKAKSDNEDKGERRGIPLFPIVCGSLLAISLLGSTLAVMRYRAYGAFYDDSWKDPSIESRFLFKNDDTESLQAIYASDPENFNTRLYDVLIVRLGCEDCEKRAGQIRSAKAEIFEKKGRPAYIIFSRSEIGQLYVSEYGITDVPVAIIGGVEIRLYDTAGKID